MGAKVAPAATNGPAWTAALSEDHVHDTVRIAAEIRSASIAQEM
jgi:hypothetical protein